MHYDITCLPAYYIALLLNKQIEISYVTLQQQYWNLQSCDF